MTFTRADGVVTLTMTEDDYAGLLLIVGYAQGAAHREDIKQFYRFVDFTNRMNNGNSGYIPYEIPPEYQP